MRQICWITPAVGAQKLRMSGDPGPVLPAQPKTPKPSKTYPTEKWEAGRCYAGITYWQQEP
ncbi:hypothetical protein GCM10025779_26920 [Arthrobacter cryoconiti]